ncbi:LytTR family DNA-binding domain-containing protein [Pedobacter sp. PLR]|uniref:LytR/AlgR family response regulator transcription factor n=1 Tax=Pedobacter sp. PLR TaxID=2994465 RepID=UPI00224586C9|nr:LytTR family DNA-binding domain-containing protein [Pedobacter sp. PLR]MCX2450099.1 LytTR family DNA-binding domain-containing protein [Pedobacter sp. PLR]
MIKVIAVDDEPVAHDIIRAHSEKIPFISLDATFLSATEALFYIKNERVDLVFLDIAMPDLSGIEFAAMINPEIQVIFTTAYPEYALKGFELAATDYLLKPINFTRFLKACQLAETRLQLPEVKKREEEQALFVKDGHDWVQIKFSNLVYAKAEDNYVDLHETGKHTLTRITLTELQTKLPANQFLRVHKSFIISRQKIERIEKHQVIVAGHKIPLSKLYRDELLQNLGRESSVG